MTTTVTSQGFLLGEISLDAMSKSPHPKHQTRVALLVPTWNAGARWPAWIAGVKSQVLRAVPVGAEPRGRLGIDLSVWVVDSHSSDHTVALSRSAGFEVLSLGEQTFSHGGTRQWAVEQVLERSRAWGQPAPEFVLLMTQDAILASEEALCELLAPFADPAVGAVYGRQLPHTDATLLAAQARFFNYPSEGASRSLEDRARLGIRAAFCSDSFAAYRLSHFLAVGGFPRQVIMGEDMWVAGQLLLSGFKVAYAPRAMVEHSHNYSWLEEFQRYVDTGVFHAQAPWLLEKFGGVGSEGLQMLKAQLSWAGQASLEALGLGPDKSGEHQTQQAQQEQQALPTATAVLRSLERTRLQVEAMRSSPRTRILFVAQVLLSLGAKGLGYRVGRAHHWLPRALLERLSALKGFWTER